MGGVEIGARWAWAAVCPRLHMYSNFSGGADPCYECGADPERVFEDADDPTTPAQLYVQERQNASKEELERREAEQALFRLADRLGYDAVPRQGTPLPVARRGCGGGCAGCACGDAAPSETGA